MRLNFIVYVVFCTVEVLLVKTDVSSLLRILLLINAYLTFLSCFTVKMMFCVRMFRQIGRFEVPDVS